MNPFYNYLYDRQQDDPVSHCCHCGTELYGYDTCYLFGAGVLCSECADGDERSMTGYELETYFKHLYGG